MSVFSGEEEFIQKQEEELKLLKEQTAQNNPNRDYRAMELREAEKSIMKEQLSLGDELLVIYNLLQGKVLKPDQYGITTWQDPTDNSMRILTEYGVHLIMNTIQFYLNKNTLLSNYDEETINRKMEDFATDLADTIFMEYEKVFRTPSLEDCIEILRERIKKKTELRVFAYELLGKKVDSKQVEDHFISEIEDKIEKEIQKIKEQLVKNNLKRFLILIREVQDSVHSTYLRAWNGQERRTIRQHISVTESIGSNSGGGYGQINKEKKSWFRMGK
ncbi:MAG: hypothetical protein EHM20_00325 [Alphaproteobacteria bacterium]|nr:MAG: hypothetical protein EHM20_00325 [Alphaproteobacteria bacterium]